MKALVKELRAVVRAGIDRAEPTESVRALRCVQERAERYPGNEDAADLAWRDVLHEALDGLGEGTGPEATRLLLGDATDTHNRALAERRRIAAYQFDLLPDTFRRKYESRLLGGLASQVFHIEGQDPDTSTDVTDDTARHLRLVDAETLAIEVGDTSAEPAHIAPSLGLPSLNTYRVQTSGYRKDWLLLIPVLGFVIWNRFGLDNLLRAAAALIAVGIAATVIDAIRSGPADGGPLRSVAIRLPRFVLLALAGLIVVGLIAGRDDDGETVTTDPCYGQLVQTDPACRPATTAPETTEPVSEHYAPTTYAQPPPAAFSPECPPAGNQERRLTFTNTPPECITRGTPYVATVATNYGSFQLALNPDAYYTANNFAYLAGWHFYDGVTLIPNARSTDPDYGSMVVGDPVAPEDGGKVPGYTLTFDRAFVPNPPEPTALYVVMISPQHPQRWVIAISDAARGELASYSDSFPLLGKVRCGGDVISDYSFGLFPAYTSETVVIQSITVTEMTPDQAANTIGPSQDCEG